MFQRNSTFPTNICNLLVIFLETYHTNIVYRHKECKMLLYGVFPKRHLGWTDAMTRSQVTQFKKNNKVMEFLLNNYF